MIITSRERSTGMGATRFVAVAAQGRWHRVSDLEARRYHGRVNGEQVFSVDVPETTTWATFNRSNSGRELVLIERGLNDPDPASLNSFEDAMRWLDDPTHAQTVQDRPVGELIPAKRHILDRIHYWHNHLTSADIVHPAVLDVLQSMNAILNEYDPDPPTSANHYVD